MFQVHPVSRGLSSKARGTLMNGTLKRASRTLGPRTRRALVHGETSPMPTDTAVASYKMIYCPQDTVKSRALGYPHSVALIIPNALGRGSPHR